MKSDSAVCPPVSIVLTAYNRALPLERTIGTLLSQTFTDFELIVCDDASSDETPSVVRRFAALDSRVVYQRHEANLGMPANLNDGVRRARGEFIANLHDGDLYHPTLIEKWTGVLKANPAAAFVFNQYRVVDGAGLTRCVHSEDLPLVFPGSRLLEGIYFRRWRFDSPVWGTVMARRSAYLDAGLFDPRFGCIADVDMWMRLAERYEVAYIPEPLISLIAHDDLPSNWVISRQTARQIFREARLRHFADRPLRKWAEVTRHHAFSLASTLYHKACLLKRSWSSRSVYRNSEGRADA